MVKFASLLEQFKGGRHLQSCIEKPPLLLVHLSQSPRVCSSQISRITPPQTRGFSGLRIRAAAWALLVRLVVVVVHRSVVVVVVNSSARCRGRLSSSIRLGRRLLPLCLAGIFIRRQAAPQKMHLAGFVVRYLSCAPGFTVCDRTHAAFCRGRPFVFSSGPQQSAARKHAILSVPTTLSQQHRPLSHAGLTVDPWDWQEPQKSAPSPSQSPSTAVKGRRRLQV